MKKNKNFILLISTLNLKSKLIALITRVVIFFVKCKRIFIIAICNGPYKIFFDSLLISYAEFSKHDGTFISMALVTIIVPNSGPVGIIKITQILCLAKEF